MQDTRCAESGNIRTHFNNIRSMMREELASLDIKRARLLCYHPLFIPQVLWPISLSCRSVTAHSQCLEA